MARLAMVVLAIVGVIGLGAAPANAAEARPQICKKAERLDRMPSVVVKADTRYPVGQVSRMGEGWVRLGATINAEGNVERMWVIDTMGAPIFAHATSAALTKARYEAGIVDGKPAAHHTEFQFTYFLSFGSVIPHARVSKTYDTAKALRALGNHRRSTEILLELNKYALTLYEYSITAYGLTMSYIGLNDRRRALHHARHAAAEDGGFADKAQRLSALNLLADLAIQDNSFREGLCAYEFMRLKYPDFKPTPATEQLVETARRELTATTPLLTSVEIVETMREDVNAMWQHEIVRPSFRVTAVQGTLKNYKLVCPTHVLEGPVTGEIVRADNARGACTLFVFGEPGARFVLEER